jgi:hypothetical protein
VGDECECSCWGANHGPGTAGWMLIVGTGVTLNFNWVVVKRVVTKEELERLRREREAS